MIAVESNMTTSLEALASNLTRLRSLYANLTTLLHSINLQSQNNKYGNSTQVTYSVTQNHA